MNRHYRHRHGGPSLVHRYPKTLALIALVFVLTLSVLLQFPR